MSVLPVYTEGMNAHKGFAWGPVLIVIGILIVGGVVYAIAPRAVLKDFFQTGDKPTGEQTTTDAKDYNPTKQYEAGDTEVKSQVVYQAKVLTTANTEFKLDADQPVTFRWTTLVPKPQEPVTYRLKVWQLMQGQSGTQAMKSNQPIVTKDVDAGTEVTVNGIYTGPCKPPYLCDFIWNVEVMSKVDTTGTTGSAPAAGTR